LFVISEDLLKRVYIGVGGGAYPLLEGVPEADLVADSLKSQLLYTMFDND